MRRRAALLLVLLAARAGACLWDTDTLAEEAKYGGEFVGTVVGHFPRNPPLYDAMRRDRLLAKPDKTPADYDDLAVACERLGDSSAALRWIDRKPCGTTEDEYRTLANRGTFLVHAWLRGTLGREAGERGLAELERAVRLNPDAHFGRERVQIRLVEELLKPSGRFEPDEEPLKAAKGYAGIVRLGAGWDSPDVFRAMAINLAERGLGAVASLALLRADELVASGRKPRLQDNMDFKMVDGVQTPSLAAGTRREFVRLRAEADEWQARRTAFMLARLRAGRHPDTDPAFWAGWTDGAPPEVHDTWTERNPVFGPIVLYLGTMFATLLAFLGAVRAVWRRWRRPRLGAVKQ